MIGRREFIAGLGGATVWPIEARAQQAGMPVIGWLSTGFADDYNMVTIPFLQSLKESGYVEGRNVAIEYAGRRINPIGFRLLQPTSSAAASR